MLDRLMKGLGAKMQDAKAHVEPSVPAPIHENLCLRTQNLLKALKKDVSTATGLYDPKAGTSHIDKADGKCPECGKDEKDCECDDPGQKADEPDGLRKDTHAHHAEGGKDTSDAKEHMAHHVAESQRLENTAAKFRGFGAHGTAAAYQRGADLHTEAARQYYAAHANYSSGKSGAGDKFYRGATAAGEKATKFTQANRLR